MSNPSWRLGDMDDETAAVVSSSSALVTIHFLLHALRRQWRFWVSLGLIGMLIGAAWTFTMPPKSVGTVTLMLAHDPGTDPRQALATDESLLRTRALGAIVVKRLGLDISPEGFQQAVVSSAVSSDVLVLEVSGPDDAAAVARARALAVAYLQFRESQIRSQLEALTRGYRKSAASLQRQLANLGEQYDAVQRTSSGDSRTAAGLLNKQAQVSAQIESTQQSIRDASLKTNSIIDASHVLDQASLEPGPSSARVLLLAMASGLIGGTAVGAGIVLVRALASDRLRLREDIALALGVPVRVSVGSLRTRARWLPFHRATTASRSLQLLVHAIDGEISRPQKGQPAADTRRGRPRELTRRAAPTHLALASVDNVHASQLVIATLAVRLAAEGLAVFLVDLTEAGGLEAAVGSSVEQQGGRSSERQPVVYRPDGVPSLAGGPAGLSVAVATDVPSTDPRRAAWDKADVVLTLAEVDPALGVDHLRSWAGQVVVLVTAGRSSADRLRTTAELIRAAGLRLLFAILVGSDSTDETPGLPDTTVAPDTGRAVKTSR